MASSVRAAAEDTIHYAGRRWHRRRPCSIRRTQRKSCSGSHWRRTARAGCLRSIARSKLFLVQCSPEGIISPASSQFENPADTRWCHQNSAENEITAKRRAEALEVPASISPAVRDLAHSWTVQNHDSRGVVNSALQFFRTQGFSYSLTPGEYDSLEEFLFRRRVGFCEHYATSFATLMRLAGIPARVVVGYLGGEYNDLGRFFLVRQSDTHAWCEVWLPENGWTRVDPTAAVAPGRASLDLTTFLETRAASGQMGVSRNGLIGRLLRSGVFTNVRFIWQTLSYEWDTRLVAFDADVQDVFLTSMGIASRGPLFLIVEILLVAIALLAIYFAWMQLRTRSRVDRVKALYESFCRKTARLGVPRDPYEGPSDFARRAAQSLPNESNRIQQIADTYILLRYAPQPAPGMLDRLAKEVNAFGARARH